MRILTVGCTSEYLCNDPCQVFAGQEIELVTLDVDPNAHPDYVHDLREPILGTMRGKFDVVFLSHVLEHFERDALKRILSNCMTALKSGGELWIYVPRLEWACEQVLKGNESIVIQGALYGGQKDKWDFHAVGFTLNALGALVKAAGMTVRKAGSSTYVSIVNGKRYTCEQNLVVGVK